MMRLKLTCADLREQLAIKSKEAAFLEEKIATCVAGRGISRELQLRADRRHFSAATQ